MLTAEDPTNTRLGLTRCARRRFLLLPSGDGGDYQTKPDREANGLKIYNNLVRSVFRLGTIKTTSLETRFRNEVHKTYSRSARSDRFLVSFGCVIPTGNEEV